MTPFVASIAGILSFFTLLADIFAALLFVILITPLKRIGVGRRLANFAGERAIFLSFLVALAAAGGSLFFSDVAGFAPCLLCWWQRIFLFPQAILLLIALIIKDRNVRLHSIVLSSLGALVATYHTFITFGGEGILPCSATGPSCTVIYFLYYGYVTVPTMSLTVFALILLFMFAPNPRNREISEL